MNKDASQTLHSFGHDSTVRLPRQGDREADRKLMGEVGLKIFQIMSEADALPSQQRESYILARLDELDGGMLDAAE